MTIESLRHYWHSLGRAGVISIPGFLLVSLLVTVRAVLTQVGSGTPLLAQTVLAPVSPDAARVVASTAVTIVTCGLIMLVAARTVLRQRPVKPWVTVCVYAAVVIGMSSMRAFVNQRTVFDGVEFVARIALGLLWIALISNALDARSEQLEALAQLTDRRRRLELLRTQSEHALADLRHRLNTLVEMQVTPAIRSTIAELRKLRESVAKGKDSSARLPALARQIREFGDNTVRELSHQLDQTSNETFDPDPRDFADATQIDFADTDKHFADADKLRRFWSLMSDATSVRPFSPIPTSATLLLTVLPTLIVGLGGSRGAAVGLLGCASVYACLKFADFFVAARLREWGGWLRLGGCLAVYLVTSVIAYFTQSLILDPALPVRFIVVVMLGLVFVGGVWSIAAAVSEQRRKVRLDLAAAVTAVDWQATATNHRLQTIRQAASRLLHGEIQGRLAAVAMRLDFATAPTNAPAASAAIDQSLDALDSVLDSLTQVAEASPEPTDVSVALNAVAASWNNAMVVTFHYDDDVVRDINEHSLAAAVVEVVREATVNAARHGSARHVDVTITSGANSIRVTAVDDGFGLTGTTDGLGLGSLARLGATWELTPHEPAGTRLTVELPAIR